MSTAFFFLSNNFNKLLLYLWFCSVETKLWFNLILKISVLSWIIPGSSYLEWRGSVSDQPLFLAWLFPVLSCMQQDRTPCQKLLLPQGKRTHSSVLFPWTPAEVPQQDHFKNLFLLFFCLCVDRNILYVSFVGSKVTSKGNVQVAPVVDVDCLHTGSSHVICLQYGTSTACAAGWQGTFLMWVRRSGPFECWCCRVCYCAERSVENIGQLFVDRFCNLMIVWAQFMKCCFISCKQFFVFLVVAWRKHFFSVFWIFLRLAPIHGDNTTWQWVLTALYLLFFFFFKSNLLYSAKCIITSLSGSMCKPNWSS